MINWIVQPETWEPGVRYYVEYRVGNCQVISGTAYRRTKGTPVGQLTICQVDGTSHREGPSIHCWELRQDGTVARTYGIYPDGKKPSYRHGKQIPAHMVAETLREIFRVTQDGTRA